MDLILYNTTRVIEILGRIKSTSATDLLTVSIARQLETMTPTAEYKSRKTYPQALSKGQAFLTAHGLVC